MRASRGFFLDFVDLAGKFWSSKNQRSIRLRTLLFAGLTVLQNVIAVVINKWNAGLFDALELHSMSGLQRQALLFGVIIVADIAITVGHLTVKRSIMIEWRTWLTEKVSSRWMTKGKHYVISRIPGEHDNPDGRIAEDCRIAVESAISLGHSLFYCIMILMSFTEILWTLSGVVQIGGFNLYGHLIWIAMVYAGLASWLGGLVGKPLTRATNANQTAEANFRYGLANARESSLAIALSRAEEFEQHRFKALFNQVLEAWKQQTTAWQFIMTFSTGYGLLSMAFPVLISSPRYVSGAITLGALMQSVQAFQHMAGALSWPVDNLSGIALWRASVERVLSFLRDIDKIEEDIANPENHLIVLEQSDKPKLVFRDLSIAKMDGSVLASGINLDINPGDRVLITGDMFTGGKLFRAIAGLRPWGSGRIELPNSDHFFFMLPRPHLLARSTLRDAVCYPKLPSDFNPEETDNILQQVGLAHLIPQLDQVDDDWTRNLPREEQQRLGIVRLLLYKPNWVFIQEALDSLDPESEVKMLQLIYQQLPHATLITISSLPEARGLHDKFLEL